MRFKRVLVTGGEGYVGSSLVPALLDMGYLVRSVDVGWFGTHLANNENLERIVGDVREIQPAWLNGVDSVIHLANIANDPGVELDPVLSWEVNVLAGRNLIHQAVKSGVSQFVYASSGSVYGVSDAPRVTEEIDPVPISTYNKTKMVAERVFLSFKDDIRVHCLRPATTCGFSPRMRLDVAVNLLTMHAFVKKKISVLGGDQIRPNIHIKDMVRAYLHFLKMPDLPNGAYNVGFENLSILEIAQMVGDFTGAEIERLPSNDPRSYRQDSSKLLETGFSPAFTVRDAIDEMLTLWNNGEIQDRDDWYTVKSMSRILRPHQ